MEKLTGIVPPLVTPLSGRDQLDEQGLVRLIDHVVEAGVAGVFVLGTTGEAPSLSYRLRRELISVSVRLVAERVPVLVGITDTSFVESVSLAEHAADCGADALVLTTPYYFPVGQTELRSYVRNIVAELPLPVMLYNMPGMTKVAFEPQTLQELSSLDQIVGVKDSSGDMSYFAEVCAVARQSRPDWTVLIGPEAKLAQAIELGANGGVAGGANVMPETFVQWHQALEQADAQTAAVCQQRIERFQDIYTIGKYASRHIKATKSALSLLGICEDLPADPFHRFLEPERRQVAAILTELGVI